MLHFPSDTMSLPIVICCGLLVALPLHYLFVAQRRLIVGPETFFLLLGVGTFAATQKAASSSGTLSHPYSNFIGLGLLAFILGTATSRFLLRFRHRHELRQFVARPWLSDLRGLQFQTVLAIGLLAIAVTSTYYYLLGLFVPVQAFQALLDAGQSAMHLAYSDLRRSTYATGAYLAPGYVNQFKNTLLPLVTIILFLKMQCRPNLLNKALFTFFLISTVLASIGSGRRYALAFFAAAFTIVGLSAYLAPFNFTRKQVVLVAIVAVMLLSGLTMMMGTRGSEKIVDHPLLWAPLQVLERMVVAPAEERLAVYELFLSDKEPLWGGGAARQLQILLPGKSDYTLSNELHELLYGSSTGNIGLDLWGNLWYDLGWFGLVIIFMFGILCNWFYVRMLRGPKRLIRISTLAYSGLIISLATGPVALVNKGLLTCVFLLLLVECVRRLQITMRATRELTESPGSRDAPPEASWL